MPQLHDLPLLQRVHQITLPTPFPVGPVHVYLMEGEPLTLIDTGPNTPRAWDALTKALADLGLVPADLQQIIISHAHGDHFGLVSPLVAASGARVSSHHLAQPIVEGWPAYFAQRESFWADLLLASEVPASEAEATALTYRGFRQLQTHADVGRFLATGDTVEMAGAQWQVVYCPGHASSLICFYEPSSGILMGNDHLLARISSNAIVEPPPLGQTARRKPLLDYWEALRLVHDLDVARVLPGHGEVVTQPRELIEERFAFYQRRLDRLRGELRSGPQTVWRLAQALFRRLDAVDTFLACSEVVGHLDVLEVQGEVACRVDDQGVWRYSLTTARSQS